MDTVFYVCPVPPCVLLPDRVNNRHCSFGVGGIWFSSVQIQHFAFLLLEQHEELQKENRDS